MKPLIPFVAALIGQQPVARADLSVLTLNVYAKPDPTEIRYTSERMERICETLRMGTWDVVMLQEVWTTGNRKRFRNCGYPHVMDLNKTGESSPEGHLGSGLMILSKYPLAKQERLILSRPTFNWTSVSHGESLVWKSVYLAQAELPNGQKIWLANTHMTANYCKSPTYVGCDSYEAERYQQGSEAATFVNSRTSGLKVIFGGDFNSGPHPYRHDRMWKSWGTLFPGLRQAEFDTTSICTSCGSNFFKSTDSGKVDHIFASPDITPANGQVVLDQKFASRDNGEQINLSDHYGWETRVHLNSIANEVVKSNESM